MEIVRPTRCPNNFANLAVEAAANTVSNVSKLRRQLEDARHSDGMMRRELGEYIGQYVDEAHHGWVIDI